MFKVNNRKNRKRCEICSKLTIKTPEDTIGVVLVSLLLTLNLFHTLSSHIVNFEQVNAEWEQRLNFTHEPFLRKAPSYMRQSIQERTA